MFLIPCPYCGRRSQIEFRWGGEAHLSRPDPAAATDQVWAEYLYYRDNLRGAAAERWVHAHGCKQWFNLIRDTRTHAVIAAYRMDEAPPERDAAGSER